MALWTKLQERLGTNEEAYGSTPPHYWVSAWLARPGAMELGEDKRVRGLGSPGGLFTFVQAGFCRVALVQRWGACKWWWWHTFHGPWVSVRKGVGKWEGPVGGVQVGGVNIGSSVCCSHSPPLHWFSPPGCNVPHHSFTFAFVKTG